MDVNYDMVANILGQPFAQQLFIWTTSLGMASFIHSSRVKQEMKNITGAINNLSNELRKDLENHSDRIGMLEGRLDQIEKNQKP